MDLFIEICMIKVCERLDKCDIVQTKCPDIF